MNLSSQGSGRKARHRTADRAFLLQAAEQVFSDRGYHATAVRDIARHAGFSVGGVYQFFPSKDDLYLAVIEDEWDQFFALVRVDSGANGIVEELTSLARSWLGYFEARCGFFRIYLADRTGFSAAFNDRVARAKARNVTRFRRYVTGVMRQAIKRGELRFDAAPMLASAYVGILQNCILDALTMATRTTPRAETLTSIFLQGAQGGRKAGAGAPRMRAAPRERRRGQQKGLHP